MTASLPTDEQGARRDALHKALYEWKDFGGSIEDVLNAIGDYVVGTMEYYRLHPGASPSDVDCNP